MWDRMPCSILKVVWVMGVGGEWGWKEGWMDERGGRIVQKVKYVCLTCFALLCYRMVVRTGNDGY